VQPRPSRQPLWDLVAALRPAGALPSWAEGWESLGRPDVTLARMQSAHRWFVEQAVDALAGIGSQ
jgi:hypothetical protein